MALNREQKRALQRQGELGPDGESRPRSRNQPRRQPTREERTSPRQFAREVRDELRKVAWPTRQQTLNYSLIVFVTLVVFGALIFGVDWVFSNAVLKLFES
ncbi:MAG: preprotein translocase subunit SecE [Acidimicrobiales bacterium]|nr:preprotein translocase subunit SecE [Acidimicrobiales bacterium]